MAENIQEEIEDKIIDYINSVVAGRLIIFKPEENILGADLAVGRRGKYKEAKIYFNVSSLIVPAKNNIFVKDFVQESFNADESLYLLFVCFNEARQKLSDYVWLIPSLEFKDTANVVKLTTGENALRFEAETDVKQQNKYSKFLVNVKDFGKLALGALENGGKFDFGQNAKQEDKINIDNFKEFLVQARQNTYAVDATAVDNPRLLQSKQLEFQKGDYFYRDIYFAGDKKFIGQEIIYLNSKPVWGMNYMGDALGKVETSFLKESLLKLVEKCRVGQSCEYEKRGLKYQDHGQGDLAEFSGIEEIIQNKKSIYKLNYQGGLI